MISIIIPTKDRWDKLQATLKAIKENSTLAYEIIIIFDGDKEGFEKFPKLKIKEKYGRVIAVYNSESQEYWHCINQGAIMADGEYIIYLADDIRPIKGWLEELKNTFEKNFPDGIGLVALKTDLGEGETHAPHGMVSKKFIASQGYLSPPDAYWHYFADTELSLRMQMIKKYACTEKVVCYHDKPQKDQKFNDKVYSESWNKCWKHDELNFHLRNPNLVAAMILVQPGMPNFLQTQLWYEQIFRKKI